MQSVGTGIKKLLSHLDADKAKALRSAQNNAKFELAVRNSWRDNPDAAEYILAHTNGLYVKKDEALRKGADKDQPHVVFGIYVDDSMALAELNARRELLNLKLAHEGMRFHEIRIHTATRGMKERHLFPQAIRQISCAAPAQREPEPQPEPISEAALAELSGRIEDPALAASFERAVAASVGVAAANGEPEGARPS